MSEYEYKKKRPVGIDDFEEMIRQDFYYVDKTGMIADLMRNWGKVNLFTRPRRFGKTLNMSMLKYFFEIGTDKSLFDELAVSRDAELCEKHMGRYPVVFLTLKDVDGTTFEEAYDMLCDQISQEVSRLQFLMESSMLTDADKRPFKDILNGRDDLRLIKGSLKMISSLLKKHYGQDVIILIDEYDVPLDKAYQHGYYDRMIGVIRAMLGAALKSNNSLFFAVLTGCLRVSKESIFTGLNNMLVHSISDESFDEYFGFTDEEVLDMMTYYGLEKYHEEAREWYDGYLFGGQKVYCPWDVINYCYYLGKSKYAEPKAYWINSSGNDIVRRLIEKTPNSLVRHDLEELIAGKIIIKKINEQLTHSEIDKKTDNIWSLLYMTGYLTVTQRPSGGEYWLCIPNREVREIYIQQAEEWFEDRVEAETESLKEFFAAFENGDTETITDCLNEQLLNTVSFYDAQESFYHGFLLALLNVCDDWYVSSNNETGKGRSDITAERVDRKAGFVIEVKVEKDEDRLDAACEAALRQIEEKDYTAELRRHRIKEIRIYGIAFWNKECRVVTKRVDT